MTEGCPWARREEWKGSGGGAGGGAGEGRRHGGDWTTSDKATKRSDREQQRCWRCWLGAALILSLPQQRRSSPSRRRPSGRGASERALAGEKREMSKETMLDEVGKTRSSCSLFLFVLSFNLSLFFRSPFFLSRRTETARRTSFSSSPLLFFLREEREAESNPALPLSL